MRRPIHYESVIQKHFNPYRKVLRKTLAKFARKPVPLAEIWESYFQAMKQNGSGTAVQKYNMRYALLVLEYFYLRATQKVENPFCYTEIIEDLQFHRLLENVGGWMESVGVPHLQVNGILNISAMIYYHAIAFELAHKRIYEVTPGLAEQLANTELKGVQTNDLQLPYESIYLVAPPQANLRVFNTITGWHRCEGMYLVADPKLSDVESGLTCQSGITRGWRVLAVGEDKSQNKKSWETSDDALVYFRIPLPENRPIDDVLGQIHDTYSDTTNNPRLDLAGWGEMAREWQCIFKWMMNAVLYVTHVEPGNHWICNDEARRLWERMEKLPKKSPKKEKLKKRFKELDPQYRWLLGSKIVINRGGKFGNKREIVNQRNILKTKVRVPGHWRRVAHGKGRSERTWRFIVPYWRNKDGIELTKDHELT